MMRTILAFALAVSASCADDLWTTKVQPLLNERCVECHGPVKAKHNLRLDSLEAVLKGGKELGSTVVAGKPDESPLIKVCTMKRGEELAMPPKGEPLTAEQIGWLKDWITAGAKGPVK